jgi:hypothetical protein
MHSPPAAEHPNIRAWSVAAQFQIWYRRWSRDYKAKAPTVARRVQQSTKINPPVTFGFHQLRRTDAAARAELNTLPTRNATAAGIVNAVGESRPEYWCWVAGRKHRVDAITPLRNQAEYDCDMSTM